MSTSGLNAIERLRSAGARFDGVVTVPPEATTTGATLEVPVVAFGAGSRPLVIVPGLGDGLSSVEGRGRLLSWYYRKIPDRYRVYIVSRPRNMPDHYPIQDMAADLAALIETAGLARAGDGSQRGVDLWGISQGGMIAQWLAINEPQLVHRLALAITAAHATETLKRVVGSWMEMARSGRHGELIRDTMRKTFTRRYLRRFALIWPFLGLFYRPKSYRRFLIQAEACVRHDARSAVGRITIPTLVIGGGSDRILGPGAIEELANLVPGSELELYPELGHGAFEEATDATARIMAFLER